MLISKSNFDLSGRTCNKIGVSHAAFVTNQGDKCEGMIGDCLGNQLDDFWSQLSDSSASAASSIPTELCRSIGGNFVHNDGYRLSCALYLASSDSPTQVLIELNAQDVSIVYNDSIGEIITVRVIESSEALIQRVTAIVSVRNTGDQISEFLVLVNACDPPSITFPLSASRVSILANASMDVPIKIEDSNFTGSVYECTAILEDSFGQKLSEFKFQFNLSSVAVDRITQAADNSTGYAHQGNGGSEGSENSSNDPCISTCTSFFSIACFIEHGCWSKLGSLLGTFGGTGLLVGMFVKLGGPVVLVKVVKSCFSCCCSNSRKTKRRNSDTTVEYPHIFPMPYYPQLPPTGENNRRDPSQWQVMQKQATCY